MAKSIQKPLTKKDLAEFTEGTLLPAVERIVDEKVNKLDEKINTVKLDLMDFIDDKITDLRGDIIVLFRKEDRRLLRLVKILCDKQVLDNEDVKILEEIPLFQKP